MDTKTEELKGALLGLIPDNWRTILVLICLGLFFFNNPQLAISLVSKLYSLILWAVKKVGSVQLGQAQTAPGAPIAPIALGVADASIESPLAAAQSQIAWAVRNGNKPVLDASISILTALSTKTAALFLLACSLGCSAQTATKAAPEDCQYSHSHSFGYMPPPPAEKERMYHDEPTLFQQEPSLAK